MTPAHVSHGLPSEYDARMRLLAAAALVVGFAPAVFAPPCARAQDARPMLVVVQSGIEGDGGSALRAQLARQFEFEVVSVRSARLADTPAPALLTLALDERAVLHASYWNPQGSFDQLSAPAPKDPAALQTAALTLAAALIQRNLQALKQPPEGQVPCDLPEAAELRRSALYSALLRSNPSRLGIALRVEDF